MLPVCMPGILTLLLTTGENFTIYSSRNVVVGEVEGGGDLLTHLFTRERK